MAYYGSADRGDAPDPEDNNPPEAGTQPDAQNDLQGAEEIVDYWPGMPDVPSRSRPAANRKPMRDHEPEGRPAGQDTVPQAPPPSDQPASPEDDTAEGMADTDSEWGVPVPAVPEHSDQDPATAAETANEPDSATGQDPSENPGTSTLPTGPATHHSQPSSHPHAHPSAATYDRNDLLPGQRWQGSGQAPVPRPAAGNTAPRRPASDPAAAGSHPAASRPVQQPGAGQASSTRAYQPGPAAQRPPVAGGVPGAASPRSGGTGSPTDASQPATRSYRTNAQAARSMNSAVPAVGSGRSGQPPVASRGTLPTPTSRPAASINQPRQSAGSTPAGRPPRRRGCGSVLGLGVLALALALLIFGGLLFGYVAIASALPSPEDLQARASQFASTQIYDRQGQILNEMDDPEHGRRTVVTLDKISKNLIDATIATEDPNFYSHQGVDPAGLARMVYYAVRNRDISGPGGSTITQQLVKLVYLSPERSVTRKVKEAVLATEISRRYSKDTVLQIYLNEIPYGNQAYGIEAAAETYFGKHASELDLAESAMLAGLPQAPSYYDPYTKLWESGNQPGPVKERQGVVLGLMVKHGSITTEQADAAWKETLNLKPLEQQYTLRAPHFVYYVRDEVEKALGATMLSKGGLKIYTTLDPKLQETAEQEVANQVKTLNARGATDGALVAARPATGEILAMVGSADFNSKEISGQINMAVSPRQPGSSIKPLTYLTAFSMPAAKIDDKTQPSDQISAIEPDGYWTPATAILDITTQFPDGNGRPAYVPKNYDGKEHNIVSVRSALANSYNIPAVKTLQHIGIDRLKDTATRMGITTLTRNDYGLSLTLGGGEVTLLEMTGAYATLATGGVRAPLSPIACVIDADGQIIWQGTANDQVQACKEAPKPTAPLLVSPQQAKQVVDAQATYLITSILSDLEARRPAFGQSASLLSLPDRPAAAKTGTTNDNRDAWTLGYTPDLAIGVWVGNADYKPMQDIAGSIGAAPVWQKVMEAGLKGVPAKGFTVPKGIQRVKVCADSGTLPSEACPAQKEEVFASDRGPLPARFDLHQRLRIDKTTSQLATEFTPADRVETKDFLIFPPRYQDWAQKHGYPQPNLTAHKYDFQPELAINSPTNNSRVTGVVAVNAHVHLPSPLVWRLEYGVGPNPVGWGVLNGPKQGDVDGSVGDWNAQTTVDKHQAQDFSLRLAAYEPDNMDYPAAVSNVIYVTVDTPTPEVQPTEPPAAEPTATPTRATTATPPAVATKQASPTPAATATKAAPPTKQPTATPAPDGQQPTPTPAVEATHVAINTPANGAQVSGRVAVMGDAYGPGFAGFQLIYAPGTNPSADAWQAVQSPQMQQSTETGGLLGFWATENLAPGTYTLRLMALNSAGDTSTDAVIVEVVPVKKQ